MADRIETLECFAVAPRWVFLKVTTADGLVGWGEPVVEGKAQTVVAAVDELSDAIIGNDPNRIEDCFQAMYRGSFYRGGPVLMSAISGIEQALWDIKGKRLGVPIYDLLGGAVRERMAAYSGVRGETPEEIAMAASARVESGWRAVKMSCLPPLAQLESPRRIDEVVALVVAVRDAVGWEVGIGIDFHGRARKAVAKVLIQELLPLRPLFIEEPVTPDQEDALCDIAANSPIPIAAGERLYGRWGFKNLIARGAIDIIQPDISHAGGIWELRKIAAAAEARDIAIAPHSPLGPINLAASLQLDFCTPNAAIQETGLGYGYGADNALLDYLVDSSVFALQNGAFARPTAPGLGIEIDESAVRDAARTGHRWRNPLWRLDDGTVAEW